VEVEPETPVVLEGPGRIAASDAADEPVAALVQLVVAHVRDFVARHDAHLGAFGAGVLDEPLPVGGGKGILDVAAGLRRLEAVVQRHTLAAGVVMPAVAAFGIVITGWRGE